MLDAQLAGCAAQVPVLSAIPQLLHVQNANEAELWQRDPRQHVNLAVPDDSTLMLRGATLIFRGATAQRKPAVVTNSFDRSNGLLGCTGARYQIVHHASKVQ